jgi:hypothetical protein
MSTDKPARLTPSLGYGDFLTVEEVNVSVTMHGCTIRAAWYPQLIAVSGRFGRRTDTPQAAPTPYCVRGERTVHARLTWQLQRDANASRSLWSQHLPALPPRRRRWLDRARGPSRRRPGGCNMWSLGPTQLIALLVAVAITAAMCGFAASVLARRNKRRTRRIFVVGFCCGLLAGGIVRNKRRRTGGLSARALSFAARPVRLGMPPHWPRHAWQSLTASR